MTAPTHCPPTDREGSLEVFRKPIQLSPEGKVWPAGSRARRELVLLLAGVGRLGEPRRLMRKASNTTSVKKPFEE